LDYATFNIDRSDLPIALVPFPALGQLVEEENGQQLQATVNAPQEQNIDLARVAVLIVEGTNATRSQEARLSVEVNPKLKETARCFADYMARNDKYGHTADGKRPAQRAAEHDYAYCIVSENIAYVYRTTAFSEQDLAKQLVEGWASSPEHRKNSSIPT
jgi:uncharacterized protein YkwD